MVLPNNPAQYEIIPRSNAIAKVLDEVEEVNGVFYTVELTPNLSYFSYHKVEQH